MLKRTMLAAAVAATLNLPAPAALAEQPKGVTLEQVGRFETGQFDEGASEIVAYDASISSLFVINAHAKTVDILDISNPAAPVLAGVIDVAAAIPASGGVNSVAVHEGLVAVAVENDDKQSTGWVVFYSNDGAYLKHVPAGALPDAVTFTHNGQYALTANEGEPSADYSVDPEGTVTVVDLRNGVMNATAATADFTAYNGGAPAGVRISGPGASVAQDLEPEFIATSTDSKTAWVTLQENNAMAIVDIATATVTGLVALGDKDHSLPGNGLDASNEDGMINIRNWPVLGTYMPDGIAAYQSNGKTWLVTANEGDGREYIYETDEATCNAAGHTYDDGDCISHLDEARIKDVTLDPVAFPDASDLQKKKNLGRLKMLSTEGDTDGDGDYDEIHVFGGRSISIWDVNGALVYDSGDTIEVQTALADPDNFNSTNDENDSFDDRSDDKGPEPEGVVVGKVRGRQYAFVGLERVGGVMIFDVTDPYAGSYVSYVNNRDFSVEDVENEDAGDLGPEGLVFIKPADSPTGEPLLVVGNEVSGTTTIYRVVNQ